jgi:UDP-glucose 4-epimerase
LSLLAAAENAGIGKLVFSSTCATYGVPEAVPMDETHSQRPINPYGRSKLLVEQMLGDLDRYRGFRSVVLRYFNAAGADPEGRIGEWHSPETHAIPLAIEAALGRRSGFKIFGADYDTRDGTCVRDFVHVMDLADAHSRAVRYLLDGRESVALNLGTGDGTTVKELLAAIGTVSGRAFPIEYAERREGDSPALVADNAKARSVLGWRPSYDLHSIIETAWDWHSRTNRGAEDLKVS